MNEETKTKAKKTAVRKAKPTTDASAKPAAVAPAKKRIVITFKDSPKREVYVSGSFNNWAPTEKKLVDKLGNGVYSAIIMLAPGIYEYKFVVDGVWKLDPDPDRDWTQNGLGTLNSVLRV